METLIVKALKKYLSVFIVNFSAENFNVSLLKGRASLSNIGTFSAGGPANLIFSDLNTAVLQELLLVPTTLQVKKAFCSLLEIDVRKLS
jgi:hypothetical protein